MLSGVPLKNRFHFHTFSWLGVWYVKREMYEQAIEYFDRAAVVQPGEVSLAYQLCPTCL